MPIIRMEVVGDQMEGNTMQRLADEIGEVTERGRSDMKSKDGTAMIPKSVAGPTISA